MTGSLYSFTVDPPRLAAVRHNGIAVIILIDDVDFRALRQADGAVPVDLAAFRRQ